MIRQDQTRPDVIDDSMIGGTAGWDRVGQGGTGWDWVGLGLTGREPIQFLVCPVGWARRGSKRDDAGSLLELTSRYIKLIVTLIHSFQVFRFRVRERDLQSLNASARGKRAAAAEH